MKIIFRGLFISVFVSQISGNDDAPVTIKDLDETMIDFFDVLFYNTKTIINS